jgi:hypothetical protein
MLLQIRGYHLPGRVWHSRDEHYDNVYVGIQVGKEPQELMLADLEPLVAGNADRTIVSTVDLTDDCGDPSARGCGHGVAVHLVAFPTSGRPRTTAVQRHLGAAGQPEPPGSVRRLADADPRPVDSDMLVAEHQPNGALGVKEVYSVVVHSDSKSRA